MFGHLKAEDFINLIESAELPAKHRSHIETCKECRSTWESMRSVHAEVEALETEVPEPDWVQFRSSIRDELLSRSIQRQTVVRRWTGWDIRPAFVWGLSFVLAVGITTATLLWRTEQPQPSTPVLDIAGTVDVSAELIDAGPQPSLFDGIVSLGDEERERFLAMLEAEQKETRQQQ